MFDIDKFIVEVQKRPAVFDVKSKDYSNKEVKARCWEEIGRAMFDNWEAMSTLEMATAGRPSYKSVCFIIYIITRWNWILVKCMHLYGHIWAVLIG